MNTDATRAHIDAETMAAWADRALPADAAAAVELHLSNCDRCQEVLAAFVRSEPAAGAVIIPLWSRRPVRWSAAGLAAAAALVAMVWIGRPPAPAPVESAIASRNVTPEPTASLDQIAPRPQAVPAPANPAPAELRRDRPSGALQDRAAAEKATKREGVGQAATLGGRVAPLAAPPPPPAAAAAPPPPQPSLAQVALGPPSAMAATTAVVTPPAGTARPATRTESVSDAFSAVLPVVEIAAPDPTPNALRPMTGGAGRGAGGRLLGQGPASVRWRIVAGTVVERSIDAGVTWVALPIEPALKTPLLAGSATSSTNCWLVGREGVVLVTHDGLTFRRVSVPEAVHLTGVTAIDGQRATVIALDGRKFSTTDGGLTWK